MPVESFSLKKEFLFEGTSEYRKYVSKNVSTITGANVRQSSATLTFLHADDINSTNTAMTTMLGLFVRRRTHEFKKVAKC